MQLRKRSSVTLKHVPRPRSLRARVITAATLLCVVLAAGVMSPQLGGAAEGATTLCTNSDARLAEASGLVVTPDGYAVVNDGGTEVVVYLLDRECAVSRILTSSQDPFDPEDLARTDDGTLWIADTGDNDLERETVVIWEVDPGTGAATGHRLAYPDGAHDAEALLMPADRTPVIVTKEASGSAQVYVAAQPLSAPSNGTGTLRAAGVVTITATGTVGGPGDAGPAAGVLVTGGAPAPDGRHAALRTYTDAYEWDLGDDGDTASAITDTITSAEPARTPIPGEPQGESIAYTSDSNGFATISEGAGQPLQQWQPVRADSDSDEGAENDGAEADDSGWGLGLPDLNRTNLMGGIYVTAILGVLLLAAGIVGILRWRRDRSAAGDAAGPRLQRDQDGDEFDRPHVPTGSTPLLYPPGPVPRQIPAGPGVMPHGGLVPPAGGVSRGRTYGSGVAASASVPRVSALPPPPQTGASPAKGAGQGRVYGGSSNVAPPSPAAPPADAPPGVKRGTVYGGGSRPEEPDA